MERSKTLSKKFFDDEIIAVLKDGSLYLKQGVRRTPEYNFSTEREDNMSYFNYWVEKRDKREKRIKDIEDDNNWN